MRNVHLYIQKDRDWLKRSRAVRRRGRRLKLYLWLALAGALVAAAVTTLRQPSLLIQGVVIQDNQALPPEALSQVVNDTLAGNLLAVIPKASLLFYPRRELKQNLISHFPRLRAVNLALGENRVLAVTVSERQARSLWCLALPAEDKQCYFIDDEGVAFAAAPRFSERVFFELYPAGTSTYPLGAVVLPPAELSRIGEAREALVGLATTTLPIKDIYRLDILNDGSYQFTAAWEGKPAAPILIFISPRQPLPTTLAHLAAVVGGKVFTKELAAHQGDLAYIDLRFGKKVFFKFNHVATSSTP